MTSADETIRRIETATGWNQRIAQIRLIPQRHGTEEHVGIFAAVARALYLPPRCTAIRHRLEERAAECTQKTLKKCVPGRFISRSTAREAPLNSWPSRYRVLERAAASETVCAFARAMMPSNRCKHSFFGLPTWT